MKFDEAIDLINEISYDEATDVWFEKEDLFSLINDLREEYAPTVEMTKKQYHSFGLWKYHTPGWNMTNAAEFARDENMKATDAMTAWLHPETIKVVDE